MARIRIIDEWLRSPVSGSSRHRAVMVVADSWAEQRVLMRAYASAPDQTRPTIMLHGAELAIGPAGVDGHGPWGIHVEPPADGRAQELRGQLELAARRLAGSKGNPPRLVDEPSRFEQKPTGQWAPGTPADVPFGARTRIGRDPYYEPAELAPPDPPPAFTVAGRPSLELVSERPGTPTPGGGHPVALPPAAVPNPAYASRARRRDSTHPPQMAAGPGFDGSRTAPGFAPLFGAPVGPAPAAGAGLARLVGRTMPLGFQLDDAERAVLNALGRAPALGASEIAELVGVADGAAWMEGLLLKLAEHGLDLVAAGPDRGGEPTYLLRR